MIKIIQQFQYSCEDPPAFYYSMFSFSSPAGSQACPVSCWHLLQRSDTMTLAYIYRGHYEEHGSGFESEKRKRKMPSQGEVCVKLELKNKKYLKLKQTKEEGY
jgi:hypothetical protein